MGPHFYRVRGKTQPPIGRKQDQTFSEGDPTTPDQSAAALTAHLSGDDAGSTWNVSDPPART